MENKTISLEYLAGFIDGEGCFNLTRCRTVLVPRIMIVNTNIDILYAIKHQYGGNVSITSVKNKPTWKPRGTWQLQCKNALELAKQLRPFLIVKVKQADLFIEMLELDRGSSKEVFKTQLNNLNKRGREITQ